MTQKGLIPHKTKQPTNQQLHGYKEIQSAYF